MFTMLPIPVHFWRWSVFVCFWVLAPSHTLWAQNSEIHLIGVGSTSPLSAFSRLLPEFEKTHPNLRTSYLPYGSGRGTEMVAAGTADFGATEYPAPDHRFPGMNTPMLFLPMLAGALVPVYNVPAIAQPLRFTPKTLAGIYLGKITRWDDPEIVAANPSVTLPATDIAVIHSAKGRGSTYIWSDYLSKVSNEWKARVGRGMSVQWPVGAESNANGNMARTVKSTAYSVGYVELGYAVREELPCGLVQNAAGKFVAADFTSIAAAASAVSKMLSDGFRYSITNAPGEASYPIASFSWLVIAETAESPQKQQAIRELMRWILSNGQADLPATGFVPVPKEVAEKEIRAIAKLP